MDFMEHAISDLNSLDHIEMVINPSDTELRNIVREEKNLRTVFGIPVRNDALTESMKKPMHLIMVLNKFVIPYTYNLMTIEDSKGNILGARFENDPPDNSLRLSEDFFIVPNKDDAQAVIHPFVPPILGGTKGIYEPIIMYMSPDASAYIRKNHLAQGIVVMASFDKPPWNVLDDNEAIIEEIAKKAVLDKLSKLEGIEDIHVMEIEDVKKAFAEEGTVKSMSGMPLDNLALSESKKRGIHVFVTTSGIFDPTPVQYVVFKDSHNKTVGFIVSNEDKSVYENRSDLYWISDDFVVTEDFDARDGTKVVLQPQYLKCIGESEGICNAISMLPSPSTDLLLKDIYKIENKTLGSAIISFDLSENLM